MVIGGASELYGWEWPPFTMPNIATAAAVLSSVAALPPPQLSAQSRMPSCRGHQRGAPIARAYRATRSPTTSSDQPVHASPAGAAGGWGLWVLRGMPARSRQVGASASASQAARRRQLTVGREERGDVAVVGEGSQGAQDDQAACMGRVHTDIRVVVGPCAGRRRERRHSVAAKGTLRPARTRPPRTLPAPRTSLPARVTSQTAIKGRVRLAMFRASREEELGKRGALPGRLLGRVEAGKKVARLSRRVPALSS